MVAGESAVMMNSVPTCRTGDLTTVTLTQGGQMSLAIRKINKVSEQKWLSLRNNQCWEPKIEDNLTCFWVTTELIKVVYPEPACFSFFPPSPCWLCISISKSGISLEGEAEVDEIEGVDSNSSLSDSVISPSSGSLFPSEQSLWVGLFLFLRFSDLDFFLFFFDLSLSSWRELFLCFFLFDEDLSFSSQHLEDSFLRGATSGLRDLGFGLLDSVDLLAACLSTPLVFSSSNFTSSNISSCHQTVNSEITASSD